MKFKSPLFIALVLMIVIGSFFRAAGFAPHLAMAVFGAAVIRDKRFAFAFPLVSMLISDAVLQLMYILGYMPYAGFYSSASFYDSQLLNYILLASLTLFGFWARNMKPARVLGATIAAPLFYFLVSNLLVWAGSGGFVRPHTLEGLMMCYSDGLPFLRSSILSTVAFSSVFFGSYLVIQHLLKRNLVPVTRR